MDHFTLAHGPQSPRREVGPHISAGQQRYANAIRSSGADEVITPEYEGGLMTGRMIQKYYPIPLAIK